MAKYQLLPTDVKRTKIGALLLHFIKAFPSAKTAPRAGREGKSGGVVQDLVAHLVLVSAPQQLASA